MPRHWMKRIPAVVLAMITLGCMAACPVAAEEKPRLRDDFDGKLALDWEIVRPDKSHYSLEKAPGKLVITSQNGSINQQLSPRAKNLFVVDIPEGLLGDFVVVTCMEDCFPKQQYEQGGLLLYLDDDNYLKFVVEPYAETLEPHLNFLWEHKGETKPGKRLPGFEPKKIWLKLIKRGDIIQGLWSKDGETYVGDMIMRCEGIAPKQAGVLSKNGTTFRPEEFDAVYDFFELRGLNEDEKNDPSFKSRSGTTGKWQATSLSVGGEVVDDSPATQLHLWPNNATVKEGDVNLQFQWAVRADVEPNQLLLFPKQGRFPTPIRMAVERDGDKLTICGVMEPGKEAPDKLETAEGDGRMMLVFERMKEEKAAE